MASLHDIKRQIQSVRSTQQITQAMELVAASKMRRAQERALGARPYAEGLEGLLKRLAESAGAPLDDPLFDSGKQGPVGYILVTADRGLCGGYNSNVLKLFMSQLAGERAGCKVIAIGSKGRDFLRRQGVPILDAFHFGDAADYVLAAKVAADATQLFLGGQVSEIRVIYTRFLSTVAQRPTVMSLMPVSPDVLARADGERVPLAVPYILEPSPGYLLSSLLPRYIAVQVHRALVDSKASELGARMLAMGAATDNAEDLIQSLDLKYNRERQAAITREITEIVGGASALK